MANGKEKSIKWLPLKYKSNTFIVSFFDMHILIKERKATHSKGYLHTHVQCKYTLTCIRLYTDLDMCKNIFMWNVTCANYPEMVGGVKWKEFIWDFPPFLIRILFFRLVTILYSWSDLWQIKYAVFFGKIQFIQKVDCMNWECLNMAINCVTNDNIFKFNKEWNRLVVVTNN